MPTGYLFYPKRHSSTIKLLIFHILIPFQNKQPLKILGQKSHEFCQHPPLWSIIGKDGKPDVDADKNQNLAPQENIFSLTDAEELSLETCSLPTK